MAKLVELKLELEQLKVRVVGSSVLAGRATQHAGVTEIPEAAGQLVILWSAAGIVMG